MMRIRKVNGFRKLSIYGFQVTENSHNFNALLENNITNLRKYLREKRSSGQAGSIFAFMLKLSYKSSKREIELRPPPEIRKV